MRHGGHRRRAVEALGGVCSPVIRYLRLACSASLLGKVSASLRTSVENHYVEPLGGDDSSEADEGHREEVDSDRPGGTAGPL